MISEPYLNSYIYSLKNMELKKYQNQLLFTSINLYELLALRIHFFELEVGLHLGLFGRCFCTTIS